MTHDTLPPLSPRARIVVALREQGEMSAGTLAIHLSMDLASVTAALIELKHAGDVEKIEQPPLPSVWRLVRD